RGVVRNTAATAGTGAPGLDAEKTWNVTSNAAGYSDLRFGGPSGVASSGGGLLFDNIKLSLIDVVAACAPGDCSCDSHVDARDYVFWLKNGGTPGDANYTAWRTNFGVPAGAGSGGGL